MSRFAPPLVAACAALAFGCGGAAALRSAPAEALPSRDAAASTQEASGMLWVLAPHPDDEALMAAHVLHEAGRAGRPLRVHVMTNGDFGCGRDGWLRERETVEAMATLGVPEAHIRFLGYPDGYLEVLGRSPLPPVERRAADGACVRGNTTYAGRGERGLDVHTARTGVAGDYTDGSAVEDLVALLEQDRPTEIWTSHPIDDHPDHAVTYLLLRRALERARLDALPTLHRVIVHAGGCWPNGSRPSEPCPEVFDTLGSPYPPLPGDLADYTPDERLPVPDQGALGRRAIGAYRSQLHVDPDHDWLGSFSRGDAVAWTERLARDPGDPTQLVRGAGEGHAAQAIPLPGAGSPSGGTHTATTAHALPATVTFDAEVAPGDEVRVHVLMRQDAPSEGLVLVLDGPERVELRRQDGRRIRSLRVPPSEVGTGRHRYEWRLDRDDPSGAVTLEVRRDARLLGVGVAAHAPTQGDTVVTSSTGSARLAPASVEAESRE